MSRPRILLVCNLDTLGSGRLPALFAKAGLAVTAVGPHNLAIRSSRHVTTYVSTEQSPAAVISVASGIMGSEEFEYTCLADDSTVVVASRALDPNKLRACLPVLPERKELVVSKLALLRALSAAGVAIPPFRSVASPGQAAEALHRLGGIVVMKRASVWPGAMVKTSARHEIESSFESISGGEPAFVQQFVPSATLSTPVLFREGRPVCWFSYEMRHPWPTPFAAASTARITDHPEMEPVLRTIGEITGYNGLAGVDWLLEPGSNRLLFLELNARPIPGMYLSELAGVSFTHAILDFVRKSAASIQRPRAPKAGREEVHMHPQTLYRVVGDRRFGELMTSLGNAPWSDPMLLSAQLRRWVTHHLSDSWKQRMRDLRRGPLSAGSRGETDTAR